MIDLKAFILALGFVMIVIVIKSLLKAAIPESHSQTCHSCQGRGYHTGSELAGDEPCYNCRGRGVIIIYEHQ